MRAELSKKDILEKLRGPFIKCFDELGSTQIIGGGGSPVQDYDQQVLFAALDWLSRPHEKPQFVVVGTYGPHFPYPPQKMRGQWWGWYLAAR